MSAVSDYLSLENYFSRCDGLSFPFPYGSEKRLQGADCALHFPSSFAAARIVQTDGMFPFFPRGPPTCNPVPSSLTAAFSNWRRHFPSLTQRKGNIGKAPASLFRSSPAHFYPCQGEMGLRHFLELRQRERRRNPLPTEPGHVFFHSNSKTLFSSRRIILFP